MTGTPAPELVFGVPTASLIAATGEVEGFRASDLSLLEACERIEPLGEFRPRDRVEEDPSFQQIIPYVALTCRGTVLLLERLSKGGEARLHGKLSIGVGGHVNPEPAGADPLLVRGLRREVTEEMAIADGTALHPELLGFIRDTSNAVGEVHFGLACRIELPEPVEVRETETLRGRWVPTAELAEVVERMETWSAFLHPALGAMTLAD